MKNPKFAEHLAVFVDVVRGGSFSSAARKRAVIPSSIAQGWTSKSKLAIEGASAGGITVGRALVERPDLFAVMFSRVSVSNGARSEFSPYGPPNIAEFGSVGDKDTAQALLAMDAYYAVRDGTRYPSVVLTTGLTAPRVARGNPARWRRGCSRPRLRAIR